MAKKLTRAKKGSKTNTVKSPEIRDLVKDLPPTPHDLVNALATAARERGGRFNLSSGERGVKATFRQPGRKKEVVQEGLEGTLGDVMRVLCVRLKLFHGITVTNPAKAFLERLTREQRAQLNAIMRLRREWIAEQTRVH